MMDTVLNLGLNEETLQGLIALTGNERFGWDAYRRFIQMFGRIVMDVTGERFDERARGEEAGPRRCSRTPTSTRRACASSSASTERSSASETGRDFPTDPLRAARPGDQGRLRVVVRQARPRLPRLQQDRPRPRHRRQRRDDGLRQHGRRLGHGRRLHARPEHRREGALRRVPHQRPGRGRRRRHPDAAEDRRRCRRDAGGVRRVPAHRPAARAATTGTSRTSSSRSSAAGCTCSRRGPRSGPRRPPCRSPSTWSRRGSSPSARRSRGSSRRTSTSCCATSSTEAAPKAATRITEGLNASPGAAVGKAVFDADARSSGPTRARRSSSSGSRPRPTTSTAWPPPRASSRRAAARRRTPRSSRARSASRAWRAARRWSSTTAPSGARSTDRGRVQRGRVDQPRRLDRRGVLGALPTVEARFEDQAELQTILGWADEVRRLQVWTNADKPEEAALARRYGAQGIGLCRTEHMFREGERLDIVRDAILVAFQATRAKEKRAAGERADRRGAASVAHVRRGDGQARGAPAGRLRGHLRGDGRPAGRHPADRPAAARVPAEPRGAARRGHPARGDRHAGDDPS